MGGVEDSHWVDMIIDEIGSALSKVDESIQKSIKFWTELTKDIYEDEPTQDLTGQPNNGEEHSFQEPPVQVEERPLQHWSMPIDPLIEKPTGHWAMRVSKIPDCLIQEQGDGDGDSDSDTDGDDDDYYYDDEEEDETTASEEDSGSSLKWKGGYDDDDYEEDGIIVTESSENMWEQNLEAWGTSYSSEEDSGSSLKWNGGYQVLKNVDTPSEEEDEVEECYLESVEQVMETLRKNRMSDLNNESSFVCLDDEDDVSEEGLFPECDWVYVTRD